MKSKYATKQTAASVCCISRINDVGTTRERWCGAHSDDGDGDGGEYFVENDTRRFFHGRI